MHFFAGRRGRCGIPGPCHRTTRDPNTSGSMYAISLDYSSKHGKFDRAGTQDSRALSRLVVAKGTGQDAYETNIGGQTNGLIGYE